MAPPSSNLHRFTNDALTKYVYWRNLEVHQSAFDGKDIFYLIE